MTTPMTPDEEHALYARPENQEPQGPARHRDGTRLSAPVPVRFPPELLEQARSSGYWPPAAKATSGRFQQPGNERLDPRGGLCGDLFREPPYRCR